MGSKPRYPSDAQLSTWDLCRQSGVLDMETSTFVDVRHPVFSECFCVGMPDRPVLDRQTSLAPEILGEQGRGYK